jgi:hypothetical protein
MSEVDKLSNSGLFPALPIADRRNGSKEEAEQRSRSDPRSKDDGTGKAADGSDTGRYPRPPKSLIDEYA